MGKRIMESTMVPEGIDKNKFFQHTECDYFPCHEGIPVERFNCMLCYCPLYTLGEACGGNYTYTSKGTKNCKACNIPHNGDSGVLLVRERFGELVKLAARE
ncbi:MAG: hypothetical protein IJI68_10760 [Eggerthellaceae bacterium]|nr:hypothetical protein [Eggerthellaceae bacterium]